MIRIKFSLSRAELRVLDDALFSYLAELNTAIDHDKAEPHHQEWLTMTRDHLVKVMHYAGLDFTLPSTPDPWTTDEHGSAK